MRVSLDGTQRLCWSLLCIALLYALPAAAQSNSQSSRAMSEQQLDAKVRSLTQSLEQTRVELAESRSEIRELRAMVEQVLKRVGNPGMSAPNGVAHQELASLALPGVSSSAIAKSNDEQTFAPVTQDDLQIVNTRLDELQQDKVESASKYRLKLSGIVLFNAFSQSGQVDNLDVPSLALPRSADEPSGSFGATLRQSIIGLTGVGPNILGARTSADVQADFFGGLASGYGSGSAGIIRMRVARIRFDWENTSIVAGLDTPFFSPNAPASYMSIAVPGFASSGNLWTWTPSIRVEHRFNANASQFKIEAGILDPGIWAGAVEGGRAPTPGEGSWQPSYSFRLSENGRNETRPWSFGASAMYFPQHFASGTVSGWGAIADWRVSLLPRTELSGEFFTGKGLDSFGGVPYVVVPNEGNHLYNYVTAPGLADLTMTGGWSQFKFKLNTGNEFNFAAGMGSRDSSGVRALAMADPEIAALSPRNQMFFVNYIFRPRSDLVFSVEYRRFRTYPISGDPAFAGQVGLAAGFLF
jgi:hypothetical protein